MKPFAMGAILMLASAVSAQQQAHPPYAPPPREVPPPPVTSEPTPGQMPPDSHAPPASPELSSSEIQKQIEKKISDEPGLAGANVSVTVDDHGVSLAGTVDSQKQHDLAMRAAQSVAGDRPIDDKLQIRGKA
jgi:hyperosmotically inducible periplasmic protein